jgi:fructuronate reductase
MPDTPQRIACDTSQKIPIRYGETIKAYLASPKLTVQNLRCIPLVLAGWCRYLTGIDDSGVTFEPSPDPRLAELRSRFSSIALGTAGPFHELLQPVLSDASIFAVDLYQAGIGTLIEQYFAEMISAPGAVRKTLETYL